MTFHRIETRLSILTFGGACKTGCNGMTFSRLKILPSLTESLLCGQICLCFTARSLNFHGEA